MSGAPNDLGASPSPHELVLGLESSIEARVAAEEGAQDEVTRVHREADQIVAAAAAEAAQAAERLTAEVLAAARIEADGLRQAGIRSAEDLAAVAARRRDENVADSVTAVLPVLAHTLTEGLRP
jgi:vacuolar-type H+-ATPase subunit E/Vma4